MEPTKYFFFFCQHFALHLPQFVSISHLKVHARNAAPPIPRFPSPPSTPPPLTTSRAKIKDYPTNIQHQQNSRFNGNANSVNNNNLNEVNHHFRSKLPKSNVQTVYTFCPFDSLWILFLFIYSIFALQFR